jgi:sugar/nucleoside kinase (ribokinase family)
MTSSTPKLLVVGSVAIDWIITPRAERQESVGGSATFVSMASAYHAPVALVGVVGKDFPDASIKDLVNAGVDVEGLEVVEDGLTFRWKGRYHANMNQRDTLETSLNCFEHFQPKLPPAYKQIPHLFLANIQPTLQLQVLEQMAERPRFVGLDTMNLWIDIAKSDLQDVLRRIDCVMLNEEEARQLAGVDNLVAAAREIRGMGPKIVVIKQGEYGAMLFGPNNDVFRCPGLPLEDVADPTGAGDCFAGGFMGTVTMAPEIDGRVLRRAMIWGSVMASFCVEGFSYDRLLALPREVLEARYRTFVDLASFPS